MLGVATPELQSRLLTYIQDTESYLSLHFDVPNVDDPTATELTVSGYTRQRLYWAKSGSSALVNNGAITFRNLVNTTIAFLGVFDAPTNGKLLFKIPLDSPKIIITRVSHEIPDGDLFVNLQ